jgi:hypothetical protein
MSIIGAASMPTDTSRTLEIESSPAKLFVLFGLGVLMTAVSVAAAVMPADMLSHGVFAREEALVAGWFGTVFFGLCTVVPLWRLFTARGPVITISPEGIRDTRVAAAFIPWSAITRISTWEYRSQKAMVLAVTPDLEEKLGLTRAPRWMRGAGRALGVDGLCVTASGVKIDYDALLQTTRDYASAWRR